ncbi:HET-domain-containing protein [Apiospora arundinis]
MASLALLPYTYHPLPANAQTRIIELFPSPPGSEAETPLRCRLRDFNVYGDMDCEDYEAVSYAWGEPRFTEQLIVDDDYFLMTTVNFRDALRRFQLPDRPRLLWIDAVCINQQDEEDKGRQIPFMSQVYSGACGVLVWLGNYPEQAESLRQVERLGRQMQMLNGQGRNEQRLLSGSEADALGHTGGSTQPGRDVVLRQRPPIVDKVRPSRIFYQEPSIVVGVALNCMQPLDPQGLQWRRHSQV